ncbi:MAG: O-antigen ligase family protein [Candidatus Komeilibacteria bacterium]
MIRKYLPYFVYILIILLPWQTHLWWPRTLGGSVWQYGSWSLYVTDLFIIALAIIVFYLYRRIKISWLLVVGVAWLVYNILTAWWSSNAFLSLYHSAGLIVAGLFVWLWQNRRLNNQWLLGSVALSGVAPALLGMYQWISQNVSASKWLGIATQTVGQSGTAVVEGAGRWLRAYGSFPHPNILAGWLVISLLALGGCLLYYYRRYYQSPWHLSGRGLWTMIGWWSSLTIMLIALLLTFSRSAWLALLVGWLAMGYLLWRQGWQGERRFYVKTSLIMLLIVLMFASAFGSLILNRLDGNSRLQVQSWQERQTGWHEAISLWQVNSGWGVGAGNYTLALANNYPGQPAWVYQPVHNLDLLLWAEIGWLGWLLINILLLLLLWHWWLAYQKVSPQSAPWLQTALAALLALLVIGLFDHYLWSLHSGILLSAVVVAWLWRSAAT